jgi:hypothetical protein
MTATNRNGSHSASQLQHGEDIDAHPVITITAAGITSPEIERIIERFARQSTVIAAQKAKTVAAMSRINEMFRHGFVTIDELFQFFSILDDTVQFSSRTQQLYDEHRRFMLQAEIEAIHAVIGLGVQNIKNEVARALDRYPVARSGGSRSLFANVSLGARVGIDGGPDIIDVEAHVGSPEPRQRFDGFVVGETGSGDEFAGLRRGRE